MPTRLQLVLNIYGGLVLILSIILASEAYKKYKNGKESKKNKA